MAELTFKIAGKDLEFVNKFKEQHSTCSESIGIGKFEYHFIPTILGMGISVHCSCGRNLLLGPPLTLGGNQEYCEEKYKPYNIKF